MILTRGARWLAGGSPGAPGAGEIWADEDALLHVTGHGRTEPDTSLRDSNRSRVLNLIGAQVRFEQPDGSGAPVIYEITSRRWSHANSGRPYYVLIRQGTCEPGGTTVMEEKPAPPAVEQRGGDHPDWDRARPGEKLPQLPDIADQLAQDPPARDAE